MKTEAATKANYTVKNIEVVAKGADIQARIFTLAPGEVIPWHRHSESTDHYFVLHGTLTINTRKPDNEHILEIGGAIKLPQTPNISFRTERRRIVDFFSSRALASTTSSKAKVNSRSISVSRRSIY
jgi:mannose-6-phosphate isomerase-like protein (cupin superfamily)